jgi:hypothetical protein
VLLLRAANVALNASQIRRDVILEVLQIYPGSTMKTETDRGGFGGKVSAIGSAYPAASLSFLV